MLKIAFVTPGTYPVPPQRGTSVEIAVHNLCNHLRKYHHITVYSKASGSLPLKQSSHNRKDIRIKITSVPQFLSSVVKHIRRDNPDWIQVENRPLYILRLKRMMPKRKMILSLHSVTFIDNLKKSVARNCLRQADVILVNSHFIKQQLQSRFPLVKTPIYVNYLGVESTAFISRYSSQGTNLQEEMRNKLGLQNKKVLLFVGRVIPLKGLHILLKNIPALIREVPNLHLLIVGQGYYRKLHTPYIQYLKKLIEPIKSHVTVLKYISPNKMPFIYHAADVVVTPSVRKEAFCLVNIEASASGIPIISTGIGGMKENVIDGYNGYIIPPSKWQSEFTNRAARLLTDPILNEEIGRNGEAFFNEKFNWSSAVHSFLITYDRIKR